jgi:two-component system chemotaxis sensor kinase CheA
MTLPAEKIIELQLMLDMTYDGDSVGITLLAEVVADLAALAKGGPHEDALRELAGLSGAADFLDRVRGFVSEYQGGSVNRDAATPREGSAPVTLTLPPDKIQELQLLLDMTHEGDEVGYQLLVEQFKELLSIQENESAAAIVEVLTKTHEEPHYLDRVRSFLSAVITHPGLAVKQVELGGGSTSHQGSAISQTPQEQSEGYEVEEGGISEPSNQQSADEEAIAFPVEEDSPPFVDLLPQDLLDNLLSGLAQPASAQMEAEEAVVEQLLRGSGSDGKEDGDSEDPANQVADESGSDAVEAEAEAADSSPGESIEVLEDLGDIAPEYLIEGDLDILQEFGTECEEHIGAIEQVILEAEGQYEKSAIDTIFRGIHSIKGGSAYFNLQEMKKCSHLLEDMLHEVRDGHRPMDNRLEQLCLFYLDCQKDALKRYREASASGNPVKRADDSLRLLQMIRSFDKGGDIQRELTPAKPAPKEAAPTPAPAVSDPPVVNKVEVKSEPEKKGADKNESEKRPLPRPTRPQVVAEPPKPKGVFPSAAPRPPAAQRKAPQPPPAPTGEPKRGAQLAKKIASEAAEASKKFVKVDTERLDNLIDLIGEMVVFSSVLVRFCKLHMSDHKDVMDAAHRVEKFSKELQDVGISMRLDPIRGLFQKMQRLVWDTSKRLGKDIVFQMEGEDTELDRNLIDRLADPLMHMVRNSLDHGIEPNDEREAEGKPRKGTIKLSAYHSGGNVHIKIQDDGRGLDPAKLIAKAIDKGIIEDGKRMSNDEAFQLIFAPGFSTAAQVTDLSGRGVGMDVVRRNVEDLRGRIHIQSSVGNGAAFIIELPLTLAIIEGIQISVGAENFIIPSLSIVEFLRPRRGMISSAMDSAETFFFRGKYLPLFRMSEVYSIENAIEDPERASIVVLEENGDQFAFLVDTIEGECSTVIKSLGEVFEDVKGVSGGAIMPQGNVVLILDVKSLVRLAQDTYSHVERVKELHSGHEPPIVLH